MRSGREATCRRGNVSASVEMFHPEIAFETFIPDAREAIIASGPDEIENHMREFLSQWNNWRLIGDDFVEVKQHNRGRESGVAVDFHYFQATTVRDGKITASYMAETRA